MTSPAFSFQLRHVDAHCGARLGVIETAHGPIETPAFMPVGTLGTVKGITCDQVSSAGAQIVLANTYHLALRPGDGLISRLGGLHGFMGWEGPILTDSGGFQIFSLAKLSEISEQSVCFRAHTDGRLMELTPERAIQIQENLGSDIAMVLDHVVALPNEYDVVRDAAERSVRWAERCRHVHCARNQAIFAIVQGGLYVDLRMRCAEKLVAMGFDGYAIGGLSVGESPEEMYTMLEATCPVLPTHQPRYLMGVGRPPDILQAIRRGVDLFDCVMPTRNGRNALAFTDGGVLRMRNQAHREDNRPIDVNCPCPACQRSRAYIRHLFMAGEMLGPILLSIHNLTYYHSLMSDARDAIRADRFERLFEERMEGWKD